jgi:hypothetical protein
MWDNFSAGIGIEPAYQPVMMVHKSVNQRAGRGGFSMMSRFVTRMSRLSNGADVA